MSKDWIRENIRDKETAQKMAQAIREGLEMMQKPDPLEQVRETAAAIRFKLDWVMILLNAGRSEEAQKMWQQVQDKLKQLEEIK